ncbi:hypothetical protein KEJ19_02255 [Candidatus Bathyarchaeota archaeon]|nr:hypothetical protein [Candidatus Bathyarchaeota archaeon]
MPGLIDGYESNRSDLVQSNTIRYDTIPYDTIQSIPIQLIHPFVSNPTEPNQSCVSGIFPSSRILWVESKSLGKGRPLPR